jgi:mono/diheme cytochrome c family protein
VSPLVITIVILAIGAGITLVVLLASGNAKRKLSSSIPPAMRPGYSDEQLEGNHLERLMSWGLVLTLFFAVFLPAYWLREPTRAQDKQEWLFARDFSRGEEIYQDQCVGCHGADARGGAAVSPYGGGAWPAPNLRNIASRYADSRIILDVREHIETTLYRGRAGSPMNAYGAAYGGPLTDFQVEALADWILANQEGDVEEVSGAINEDGVAMTGEELYQANCAKCHGAQLEGIVGPSLQGVFERHNDETILGILQNGISLVGSGMSMPPWQEAYMYPGTRFDDDALNRIIDYLREAQDESLWPDDVQQYQTPNTGEPLTPPIADDGDDADADDDDESIEA